MKVTLAQESIVQMTLPKPDLKGLPSPGIEMRRSKDIPKNLNLQEEGEERLGPAAKNPKNLTHKQSKFLNFI